jgi:SAM-dependent methyltransferase
MVSDTQHHWDVVYGRRAANELSWFEGCPTRSLDMITAARLDSRSAVIDVGGGASTLVDELLERGFTDLTLLDVSEDVLAKVDARLGDQRRLVALLQEDITAFQPARKYALWHDRAVFHFLTSGTDRERYRNALLGATKPGSHVIIATFGPEGPTRCSGLDTRRYDATTLAAELGSDFDLRNFSIDFHPTPAGVQQQFLYTHFLRR